MASPVSQLARHASPLLRRRVKRATARYERHQARRLLDEAPRRRRLRGYAD